MVSYSTHEVFSYNELPTRNSPDSTKIPTPPYSRSIISAGLAGTGEGVSKKMGRRHSPPLSISSYKQVKAMAINDTCQHTSPDMPASAQALVEQHTPIPCAPTQKPHTHENSTKLMQWHQQQLKADLQQFQARQSRSHTRPNSLAALKKQYQLSGHALSASSLAADSIISGSETHDKDTLRRMVHCAVERDRRERIKVKLDELKAAIPACAGMATTQKLVLLENAVLYIKSLEALVGDLEVQVNQLESPDTKSPSLDGLDQGIKGDDLYQAEAVDPVYSISSHMTHSSTTMGDPLHQQTSQTYLPLHSSTQTHRDLNLNLSIKTEQLELAKINSTVARPLSTFVSTPVSGTEPSHSDQGYYNAGVQEHSTLMEDHLREASNNNSMSQSSTNPPTSRQSLFSLNLNFSKYEPQYNHPQDPSLHQQHYQYDTPPFVLNDRRPRAQSPNNALSVGSLLC
ncbi:hypothetical protein BASA50_005717 [Batrachochytrium salamandrivorans]|uniref:BHLH domain-containing protein n=1 Tax=Batrachochytrium salamandrivorans TaxID=1357716 RepID=A0ABQ8FBT0_9FUNG|nr:hypothetical protein BASA61_005344 [Batrachochytrium salamandrivorans]KAH6595507.1 hypothetical protein BASA50_005717 [Batrachochytrium salamandrivorans]KAH9244492.1 hypothetical protein BASA81_018092 [Batrachochytrium salamandrivorans]